MTKKPKAPIVKREPRKKTNDIFTNLRPLPPPHPAAVLFGLATDPELPHAPPSQDVPAESPAAVTRADAPHYEPLNAAEAEIYAAIRTPDAQSGGSTPMQDGGSTPMQKVEIHSEKSGFPLAEKVEIHSEKSGNQIEEVEILKSTPPPKVEIPKSTLPDVDFHSAAPARQKQTDRHGSGRKPLFARVDSTLHQQIQHFLVNEQMDLQTFIEAAATHFMRSVEIHKTGRVEIGKSHDDLTIYDTREDIITLYKELTGNRWKPADDRIGKQFNRADVRIVELGMLYTFLRFKGKQINSFKYFQPEIENLLEELRGAKMADETMEYLLRQRRQQVKAKRGD